jgi:hypothetical protein
MRMCTTLAEDGLIGVLTQRPLGPWKIKISKYLTTEICGCHQAVAMPVYRANVLYTEGAL